MAEMAKAIKLTPHGPNVHLKLSDILSQGSIILGFPCLSDEQVEKNADHIRKLLSSQTTAGTAQGLGSIKTQLVDIQIKKNKREQLKKAIDRYNSEAAADENNHITYEYVSIFTTSFAHILAVSETTDSNNRHPVFFQLVPSDCTDNDDDLSTTFVKMTDIDQQAGISVTMFFHFFDETTVLPMGTIQPFSRSGDNRLYVYNSPGLLNDSNDPPPTGYHPLLCYLAQKVTGNQNNIDQFLFRIGGILEQAHVYPIQNPSNERVCKDDTDNAAAVIKNSTSFELTIRHSLPI